MARKEETRQFGEVKIKVKQFGARRALAVMTKLSALLAPVLGQAVGKNKDIGAMLAMMANIDPERVVSLADDLAECSTLIRVARLNDKPKDIEFPMADNWDDHFSGDMNGLVDWLRFAAEVNFSDFFAKAMGSLASAKATESSPSQV